MYDVSFSLDEAPFSHPHLQPLPYKGGVCNGGLRLHQREPNEKKVFHCFYEREVKR